MKNLIQLSGIQKLSTSELKSINGGKDSKWCQFRPNGTPCGGPDYHCCGGTCTYAPNGVCV